MSLDTANPARRSAAHVAIYHRGHRLYETYKPSAPSKAVAEAVIPTVLMVNRWDGRIGFPGGHVDPGETPAQAAIRELREEINFTVDSEDQLKHLGVWEGPTTDLHFFAMELPSPDFQDFKNAVRDATSAEHFGSEITGVFLQHLWTYDNGMGLTTFLQSANLVYAVSKQLQELLNHITDVELLQSSPK